MAPQKRDELQNEQAQQEGSHQIEIQDQNVLRPASCLPSSSPHQPKAQTPDDSSSLGAPGAELKKSFAEQSGACSLASSLVLDLSASPSSSNSSQVACELSDRTTSEPNNNEENVTGRERTTSKTLAKGEQQQGVGNVASRQKHHSILCSATSANTQTSTTYDDEPSSLAGSWSFGKPGLLYCSREPLRLKNFKTEVRAAMDVEQFCYQAELLLDLSETSIGGIVELMLAKVVENEALNGDKLAEIRDTIFIPGSAALMARTIQGYYSTGDLEPSKPASSLSYDQSWLCALCNLSQVSKRHMVFARFKQAVNMGESAREVRLFCLIVVPTKEKSTKDDVETGRTFASMLTGAHFRSKLLQAPGETEFRALMMLEAQQMAQAQQLKNRYKYRLNPIIRESISSSAESARGSSQNAMTFKRPLSSASGKVFTTATSLVSSTNEMAIDELDETFSSSPAARADGLKSRLPFNRNPRTSKLFELISIGSKESADKLDAAGAKEHMREFCSIEANRGHDRGACCARGLKLFGRQFGRGLYEDFKRRLCVYPSDFKDAFVGPPRTIQKTVATIWFLYFGILLPTIAFSSLNTIQTHGHMGDLRKAIIGQAIGGLCFALLGGQPLVIIMTTAPLCLYTRVIHQMCLDYELPFPAMYAAVGLWNGFFLVIYSLFGFSELMKWCTRSTEEIFALFIVVAFVTDAGKDLSKNFKRFYFAPACEAQNARTSNILINASQTMFEVVMKEGDSFNDTNDQRAYRDIEEEIESSVCRRETSLLFVLLMLGTLWLAITLYKFRRTPYLSASKRDALADYALPMAVILMSLVGSTVFSNIYTEKFPPLVDIRFEPARVDSLPWAGLFTSMGLGFMLSLLFFMDQNISAAMVMAPQNRLKKGSAYHYDLLIVGLMNGALALYGLPMMHGVLPHSPLHARSLADIEERIEEDHSREVVVNARETRVTAIVAHVLVLLSLLLIPHPIAYIPRAVLNGLFLYMAVTSLDGLQVFERILLLVTEQNKYPPNHYIRRCPQRKIHQFTLLQLGQLAIMCLFGFSPITVVEMFFPVFILLMIPFRHRIVPKLIGEKYLDSLDGKH